MNILDRCELLGTDCRADAIAQAVSGIYSAASAEGIPPAILHKFFELDGPIMRVARPLRERATWKVSDFLQAIEPGAWDVILWRNVAMYLVPEVSEYLWKCMEMQLATGGFLVVGEAEARREPCDWPRSIPAFTCAWRSGNDHRCEDRHAVRRALVGLLAIGVVSFVNMRQMMDRDQWVAHTHLVIEKTDHVLSALKDAETGQRGYIITDRERYLQPYNRAVGEINGDLAELRQLTSDDPAQQKNLDRLDMLARQKLDEIRQTLDLERNHHHDRAVEFVETDRGKKTMDDAREVVAQMEANERHLLAQRDAQADAAAGRTIWTLAVWMPLSLLVLAVAALVTLRKVRFGEMGGPPAAPRQSVKNIALRYALAVVAVAVAAALKWWLESAFGAVPTFLTFYPAILLVAVIAGGGPGIFATLLAAAVADYWFIAPYGSFHIDSVNDIIALCIFLATGVLLSVVAEQLQCHRWADAFAAAKQEEARTLAEKNEELRSQSEELAQQSEELAQQNEELNRQGEELAQQNEKCARRRRRSSRSTASLARREGLLERLLESTRRTASERAVMDDLCATALEMLGSPSATR